MSEHFRVRCTITYDATIFKFQAVETIEEQLHRASPFLASVLGVMILASNLKQVSHIANFIFQFSMNAFLVHVYMASARA